MPSHICNPTSGHSRRTRAGHSCDESESGGGVLNKLVNMVELTIEKVKAFDMKERAENKNRDASAHLYRCVSMRISTPFCSPVDRPE